MIVEITQKPLSPAKEERKREILLRQMLLSERLSAIGETVGGIVHTMNNPLTVIRGFCQLLMMRKDLNDKVREDLGAIAREGERLSAIVGQLADLARQSPSRAGTADPGTVLEDCANLLEDEMQNKGVRFVLDAPAGRAHVKGEPDRLRTAFLSILRFLLDGGSGTEEKRWIEVLAARKEDRFIVTFSSNRCVKADPESLFNPFTGPDNKGGGYLGLCVAFQILKKCDGKLWFKHVGGAGCRFIAEMLMPAAVDMGACL